MTQTQAIERSEPRGALALADGSNSIAKLNMRELKELASVFVESGAFNDVKAVAQAMVKIIAGQELGFSPIVSMTGVHFFNGKVQVGANLMASLIKSSGKYEYDVRENTAEACEIQFFSRHGSNLRPLGVPVRYTIEDARNAKLLAKDNWQKFPGDMLFAACIRQGARRHCADVLRGVTADHETEYEPPEPMIETVDGETVDLATGEVVEKAVSSEQSAASSQPAAEALSPETVEYLGEVAERETHDVLGAINDLLVIKFGDEAGVVDEAEVRSFLRGRDPSQMPVAALEKLLDELRTL